MSTDPDRPDPSDDSSDDSSGASSENRPDGRETPGENPTGDPANPFQELFRQLAGGTTGPGAQPDIAALLQQVQQAMTSMGLPGAAGTPASTGGMFGLFGQGPTQGGAQPGTANPAPDALAQLARRAASQAGGEEIAPDAAATRAVSEAAFLADSWLDAVTEWPATGARTTAWSRADWIEQTIGTWHRMISPVAEHLADAMAAILTPQGEEEARMLGGLEQFLQPMLRQSGVAMFQSRAGAGVGRLATEVVSASEVGLPLTDTPVIALLPSNVEAMAEGLDQPADDLRLYLVLREAARQRLYASAPWLRPHLLSLVERYASGIRIDTDALEEAVGEVGLDEGGFDPSRLKEMTERIEGKLFSPERTPEQSATLTQLETLLALVEGWVDDVVAQATHRWMPNAAALAEVVRRRRATGGPAEEAFHTLVGLELRPRRLRDAATLFAAVRDARGSEGREDVWRHPDLLPGADDLDDPIGFVQEGPQRSRSTNEGEFADFDSELARLLDGEND